MWVPVQLDLQYPAPGSTTARPSFADVVQRSLADEKTLKMWFDETLGYQIVQSKRCPENLPPALLINTGTTLHSVPSVSELSAV